MARILVVDDRAPNRDLLRSLLQHFEHDVREAGDGVEALEAMAGWTPHLVVTDIVMPRMDGMELVRGMRAEPALAAVPVIFYTATYRAREARKLADSVGVRWVLAKPSEPPTILATVYEALKQPLPAAPGAETASCEPLQARSLLTSRLKAVEDLNRNLEGLLKDALNVAQRQTGVVGDLSRLEQSIESVQSLGLRLASLVEIGLELAAERTPQRLLDAFCRAAQDMVSSRHAGVAILEPGGRIGHFSTRGFDDSVLAEVGDALHASAPVAQALREQRCVRMCAPLLQPAALGPKHPPVQSVLVVPLTAMGRELGWLYAAERLGRDEFTQDDERIATSVAAQLASAWTNLALFNELNESREELDGLVGSAMDAIISVDEEQRIVLVNPAAVAMFGYAAEEIAGKPLGMLLPERHRSAHTAAVDAYREAGITSRRMGSLLTVRGMRRNGEEFPLEVSISRHVSGKGHCVTAILRDMTDVVRAQEELRESERRFRQIAENIRKVFYLIDPLSGSMIYLSPAYEEVFGRDPALLLADASTYAEMVVPEDRARVAKLHAPRIHVDPHEVEYRIVRPDGAVRVVLEYAWPVLDDAGAVYRAAGIIEDITERRTAEDEVRRLNAELEKRVAERTAELAAANKELEAFDYSIAHDIRAPLRRIQGFVDALAHEMDVALTEEARRHLQRITASAHRMDQLVQDLFSLSTVTTGDMIRAEVDLGRLAAEIVARMKHAHPQRTVDFVCPRPLAAHADPGLMRILLDNLLGNAWKFSSRNDRARIEVGAETRGSEHVFFVRDDGAGFDMARAERLFTPFKRLHSADQFDGTGIGLATVSRIVRRHGGRVWAESAPGRGATFFFTLEPESIAA